MELLSPKNDFVFKKIFQNLKILAHFLAAVLGRHIQEFQDLELEEVNLNQEYPESKLGILDVLCRTKEGTKIHIEMQFQRQAALWERIEVL